MSCKRIFLQTNKLNCLLKCRSNNCLKIESSNIMPSASRRRPSLTQSVTFHATSHDIPCNMEIPRALFKQSQESESDLEKKKNHQKLVVVLVHPMALLGGDMNNYVICWLQEIFAKKLGLPTLRYTSQHTSIRGWSEVSDCRKIVEWCLYDRPSEKASAVNMRSKEKVFSCGLSRVMFRRTVFL